MLVTLLLASSMVLRFTVLLEKPPSSKSLESLLHSGNISIAQDCNPPFLNLN